MPVLLVKYSCIASGFLYQNLQTCSNIEYMAKQLPESVVDRRNVLNNHYALEALQEHVGIKGIVFEGELKFTAKQVADFYEVDRKTVNRYLSSHADELKGNGYEVLVGERLQEMKKARDIDVPRLVTNLGIFNFKAFINIGLLLVESERARLLRRLILDLVIDVVSTRAGGNAKYINQRDEAYLMSLYLSENYRDQFKLALHECVDMGRSKYAVYTNEIYKSIFKERAQDYRKILSLDKKENVRDTMYAEVLTTISMYETGLANEIRKKFAEMNRKLTIDELDELFEEFQNNPIWVPQLEMVRMKMASRDNAFRDVKHTELSEYITPVDAADFERFLGEKSKDLAKRVEQYQDVFKRLKDK